MNVKTGIQCDWMYFIQTGNAIQTVKNPMFLIHRIFEKLLSLIERKL